jgi:hypothetical protein
LTFAKDANSMTAVTWTATYNGTSPTGAWSDANDWSTGLVPGGDDDVSISNVGGVDLTDPVIVNSLTLGTAGQEVPPGVSETLLQVSASLTVTNALVINAGGIEFSSDQIFDGNTISLLAFPQGSSFVNPPMESIISVQATLTLGTSETLLVKSNFDIIGGPGGVVNLGAINFTPIPGQFAYNSYVPSELPIASGSFENEGTINVGVNELSVEATTAFANGGVVVVDSGTVEIAGSVSGDGTIAIAGGGTVEIGASYGQQVFGFIDDSHNILKFHASSGANAVLGFQPGDTIELVDTLATVAYSDTTLSVDSGGVAISEFILPGLPAAAEFSATTDASNDTFITETIPCFVEGTLIRTPAGDVPIEWLRVGDKVVSAFGGTVPVAWLGHRFVRTGRHRDPAAVWPVRVQAGAFGDGVPARDLRLSPEHCVYLDGVLVPVGLLVNGRSIMQERVATVTYWHVEVPQHDVILAEGAGCESYLDTGNRADFDNGGTVVTAHPAFGSADEIWRARACAPQCREGAVLEGLRRRLAGRAETVGLRERVAGRGG